MDKEEIIEYLKEKGLYRFIVAIQAINLFENSNQDKSILENNIEEIAKDQDSIIENKPLGTLGDITFNQTINKIK